MNLNSNVYFVKGFKNAAVYDLNTRQVYAINEVGKKILEKYLKNDETSMNEDEKEFIDKLVALNILTQNKKDKINLVKPNTHLIYTWLELTDRCNMNCVHCYGEFGKPSTSKNEMLSTTEWKQIIDELIQLGCLDIQLIGGEPTVHKDFFDILKYAHDKGMKRIDVFTNATLINENNISVFKENNCNVRVSVYGHNSEIHDKITKYKGSFEKTKNALCLLKKHNIPTKIAVVIMKENEKYVEDIKKFIHSIGHEYTGYDVIRPSCANTISSHTISDVEVLRSRYNVKPIFRTSKEEFFSNYYFNSCWNGKLAITAKGDVIPCIFARDEVVGNVRKNSIDEIKKGIIEKWSITKDKIDVCKDCEFRYCCHDCRPISKGINGDVLSKYPRCCYDPYAGVWRNIEDITREVNGGKL